MMSGKKSKGGKGEPHVFKEKSFKKKQQCSVCHQNIDTAGSFCRVCKIATHRKCEFKVTSACITSPTNDLGSTKSLTYAKQRNTLPRSFSIDRVMERVMERYYDFDLTYITERIISVFFPPRLEEQRYCLNLRDMAFMLKSKHQDKFVLLNLSERHHDITRLNAKVHDFGWPDLHAPSLDKICTICKAMEMWLISDPQHVVVLHCKGNKGKTGVIIAAYMHYSKISAGADQALSTLAMRKFCEDKVSSFLQPSQKRYIYYFGGLLSGAIKMNSSPLFLHQVLIPSLPNFQGDGGYCPFLKIYQSMQLVYTSGINDLHGTGGRWLCVTIEPALLLKGDIMVKCYHRQAQSTDRDTVFRLQFHTCTIHGYQLWFGKGELDEACTDERFPSAATVEFVFSCGPEKIKSRVYQKNDPVVTVDYNTADPVVRWDSYENFNQRCQDNLKVDIAHTRGPVDGSLYAQIKKQQGPGSGSLTSATGSTPASGFAEDRPDHLMAQSSDSTLSAHSVHSNQSSGQPEHQVEPCQPLPPTRQEREELERLLGGIEGNWNRERETAILDDGVPLPSERSGTLKLSRSCFCWDGYQSQHCVKPGCECTRLMPNGYCIDRAPGTNGPLGPTPSVSPYLAAPPSHMDLCQHYSPHSHQSLPPPYLVWEHQSGPPHYPHCSFSEVSSSRHISLYTSPDLTPHSCNLSTHHLLSPLGHQHCRDDDYDSLQHLFPPHGHYHAYPHKLKSPTSTTYRDVMLIDGLPQACCHCRDCSIRRQDSVACHNLRLDQGDIFHWDRKAELQHREVGLKRDRETELPKESQLHWERDPRLRRGRDLSLHWESVREAELHWERDREADYWHRRTTVPISHSSQGQSLPTFTLDPLPSVQPAYPEASRSHVHSNLDLKYSSSSNGYQTPRQVYPCSPYHTLPSQSRNCVSDSQSESTSPLSPASFVTGPCNHSNGKADHNYHQPESHSTNSHIDGLQNSSEGCVGWNDHITHSFFKMVHREGQAACATPPDMSETPTPVKASSPLCPQESPSPREREIQTTAIISSGYEASQPPDRQFHESQDSQRSGTEPSFLLQVAKDIQSPRATPQLQKEPHNHCPAPTDPSSTSQNTLPFDSATPSTPNYSLSAPDKHSQSGPLTLQTPHASEGASFHSNYSTISIPLPHPQPPLTEKRHLPVQSGSPNDWVRTLRIPVGHVPPSTSSATQHQFHVTFSPTVGEITPPAGKEDTVASVEMENVNRVSVKFVQDSSRFWYKPGISREQAITALKEREPGTFLVRDSNSFQGAYGLALKVATPPPNVNNHSNKVSDPLEQLVRHFLIETGPRGVKIKGCQSEPCFGTLSALVYQHSITPITLPCPLKIPENDLIGEVLEVQPLKNISTAADLLKQGAACNVLYLNSVETESLTGPQAIAKATDACLGCNLHPTATMVQFKVTSQGITLTDSQRRVFFRRHYPLNSVTFSSIDPKDRRWTKSDNTTVKVFGFVAKKPGGLAENVCHLFAELDPDQPASAIVNFINKVMLSQHRQRDT